MESNKHEIDPLFMSCINSPDGEKQVEVCPVAPSQKRYLVPAVFILFSASVVSPAHRDAALGLLLLLFAYLLGELLPYPTTPLFWHGPIITALTLSSYLLLNSVKK
eukprot:TRINITY_DN12589_c0_g1_i1.p1 TRINITY_DN12589_c0_g1~~TRINITY_DN12589_c0_g1_i1.p1  ORF type:complete len:106 (+),score=11.88 TRINITY_DN12589_c0_g1_i1:40-357(+)